MTNPTITPVAGINLADLTDDELSDLLSSASAAYGDRLKGRVLDLVRELIADDAGVAVVVFSSDEWENGYFFHAWSAGVELLNGTKANVNFDDSDQFNAEVAFSLYWALTDLGGTMSVGDRTTLRVDLRDGTVQEALLDA